MNTNIDQIKEKAAALAEETVATRHYLHAHPELPWQEVETTRFLASKLEEIGFRDLKIGVDGKNVGIIADLVGCSDGPCVALRSDIDALAVDEESSAPWKSTVPGVMHACGHDAHASMLLSTAKILYSMRDRLPGKVRFIFQPAEEHGIHSGANMMIREGVLKGVDAIAGMHLWSHVPSGRVQWRSGPVMASADGWEVKFFGRGGHGGMPHDAIDPSIAAANFILALQTLVSREVNPLETAVVSLGKLVSGDAINIIPDRAEMIGNIRTFSVDVRKKIEERLPAIAGGIAATYRCKVEAKYICVYPNPVINDKALTELFRETAVRVVGAENVEERSMLMTSEDFSFYQTEIPGVLFFMGCGNEGKGTVAPHHSPRFDVDDDVLPRGISLMSSFAFAMLEDLNTKKKRT